MREAVARAPEREAEAIRLCPQAWPIPGRASGDDQWEILGGRGRNGLTHLDIEGDVGALLPGVEDGHPRCLHAIGGSGDFPSWLPCHELRACFMCDLLLVT
jgi:hypothetical protein